MLEYFNVIPFSSFTLKRIYLRISFFIASCANFLWRQCFLCFLFTLNEYQCGFITVVIFMFPISTYDPPQFLLSSVRVYHFIIINFSVFVGV
jgi:hypothetical protein